jgi:hypothetical protein
MSEFTGYTPHALKTVLFSVVANIFVKVLDSVLEFVKIQVIGMEVLHWKWDDVFKPHFERLQIWYTLTIIRNRQNLHNLRETTFRSGTDLCFFQLLSLLFT